MDNNSFINCYFFRSAVQRYAAQPKYLPAQLFVVKMRLGEKPRGRAVSDRKSEQLGGNWWREQDEPQRRWLLRLTGAVSAGISTSFCSSGEEAIVQRRVHHSLQAAHVGVAKKVSRKKEKLPTSFVKHSNSPRPLCLTVRTVFFVSYTSPLHSHIKDSISEAKEF